VFRSRTILRFRYRCIALRHGAIDGQLFFPARDILCLSGAQCLVAHYALRKELNPLQQIAAVAAIAWVSAAIWYVLAVKYEWALPGARYGLGVAHPKQDAGILFVMGWVWYALSVVNRINRRK